jgi:hypothetical protein
MRLRAMKGETEMNVTAIKAKVCLWLLDFALKHHPDTNSNIVSYAEKELRLTGWYDTTSFYGDMMAHAVMRMVKVFAVEGHSGMSAGVAASLADKLTRYQPLMPLTGEDDEWTECGSGVFQNKRFSSIFKENDEAYWSDGRVFREPDGGCYTSRDSRVPVTFPWEWREPEIVDVLAGDEGR